MNQFDYPGNATPAPTLTSGGTTVDDELLASYSPPPLQKGITLKRGQGILLLGTLLAYEASSKRYVKTTDAAQAVGFLRRTTNTGAAGDTSFPEFVGNIVKKGQLKLPKVQAANSGVSLTGLLGGRVDEPGGMFIF
jgi:hypothetical protein